MAASLILFVAIVKILSPCHLYVSVLKGCVYFKYVSFRDVAHNEVS